MHFSQTLQFILSGITVGSIYALTALGFTIIYNSSHIINFAQGEFVMLGGLITATLYGVYDFPLILAVIFGIAITTLLGMIFERLAIFPRRRASIVTLIIITIGGSIFFQGSALHVLGEDPLALPFFIKADSIKIFGAVLHPQSIIVLVVTAITVILLQYFYKKTLLGKAMRACADNREAARIVGINSSRVSAYSFGLSATLGSIGGIIITPIAMTAFNVGGMIGLKGFAAAILGGLGNPMGAVVGGITLGLIENLSIGFISSGYKDVIALTVLLLVLFFKPSGILGSKEKLKV